MKPSVRASSVEGLRQELKDLRRMVMDVRRDQSWEFDAPEQAALGSEIIDMGDGAVYTGYSKPYYPLRPSTLARVAATLTSTGSTATDATIYRNGTNIGTLQVPAGETMSAPVVLNAPFSDDDYWQMQVTQAGSGASGLTFYGDFV